MLGAYLHTIKLLLRIGVFEILVVEGTLESIKR